MTKKQQFEPSLSSQQVSSVTVTLKRQLMNTHKIYINIQLFKDKLITKMLLRSL